MQAQLTVQVSFHCYLEFTAEATKETSASVLHPSSPHIRPFISTDNSLTNCLCLCQMTKKMFSSIQEESEYEPFIHSYMITSVFSFPLKFYILIVKLNEHKRILCFTYSMYWRRASLWIQNWKSCYECRKKSINRFVCFSSISCTVKHCSHDMMMSYNLQLLNNIWISCPL